jgi:CRP/FNR family nitrogen fixation transcriptional regulator
VRSSSILSAERPSFGIPAADRFSADAEEVRLIGVTMRFAPGREICGQGGRTDNVYRVISGAVRSFRLLSDGRRQICEFYLPGDIFGIELGAERLATAEALAESVLLVARRSALLDGDRPMASQLWKLAVGELQRSQDHVLTLGRRSASERVVSFLIDLADRLGIREDLELPMSRQDIADYLGLTIETVSRTLTQLQAAGLIKVGGCRSIRLRRRAALADLCE